MIDRRKKGFVLVLMLFLSSAGMSAYPNLHFHNLNMSHGISDNYVRSISRDAWGMMWFATLNGINSYDGYRFKQYEIRNDQRWNDAIYNIYESADSVLWVTGAMHTYVYHREGDYFEADIMTVLERYGISVHPDRIVVDKDHNLWAWNARTLWYYDYVRHRL